MSHNTNFLELVELANRLDAKELLAESRSLIEELLSHATRARNARNRPERVRLASTRQRAFTRLLDWLELIISNLTPEELELHMAYVHSKLDRGLGPHERTLGVEYTEALADREVAGLLHHPLDENHPALQLGRGVVFETRVRRRSLQSNRKVLDHIFSKLARVPGHLFEHVVFDNSEVPLRRTYRLDRLDLRHALNVRSLEFRNTKLSDDASRPVWNQVLQDANHLSLVDCSLESAAEPSWRPARGFDFDALLIEITRTSGGSLSQSSNEWFVVSDRLHTLTLDSPKLFEQPDAFFDVFETQLVAKLIDTVIVHFDPSFHQARRAEVIIERTSSLPRVRRIDLAGAWPERYRRVLNQGGLR